VEDAEDEVDDEVGVPVRVEALILNTQGRSVQMSAVYK
jgi:hypothetical protein